MEIPDINAILNKVGVDLTGHENPRCTVELLTKKIDELIRETKWQPIETAPKDKSVLLYDSNRKEKYCGRWDKQKYNKKPNPYWEKYARYSDIVYQRTYPPTHWMPLPQPPMKQDQDDEQT